MATVAHRGVAIVAMPITAVDRRSLSQAWYDALHLAASPPPKAVRSPHFAAGMESAHVTTRNAATPAASTPGARVPNANRTSSSRPTGEGRVAERRAPRSHLAGRIEARLAAARPDVPQRLTLAAGNGRVQILVHGTRIVAICSPSLREAVSRALVEARYHLAARGLVLQTAVRERAAC